MQGGLLKSTDGFLYGVSYNGGDYGNGCVFRFNPNDNTFNKIHDFINDTTDGGQAAGSLIQTSNGVIFGLTSSGGANGGGTMFSLDVDYCCPINETISLSSGFTAPDVNLVWVSGNPQICISIDDSTFAPPPYQVTISGVSYDYDLSLSANCYTLSGCGNVNVSIQNFSVDDDNYSTLVYFTGGTNTGRNPYGPLMQANNGLFYGTTYTSVGSPYGTIFTANTLGQKGEIVIFNSTNGSQPRSKLIQASNGILYGMATGGGQNFVGTLFSCSTSGNYGVIHNFNLFPSPNTPYGALLQASNGKLYGTTVLGGVGNEGTIFSSDTLGNVGIVHSFNITNGSTPYSTLIQGSDGILYGTTRTGGNSNFGVVFGYNISGSFNVIYNFSGATYLDGAYPYGELLENNNGYLYGMTNSGGLGFGTIFKIKKDGTNYSVIHTFGSIANDGSQPYGSLFKSSNGLIYGTTYAGGTFSRGVIFKLDTFENYSIIHNFSGTTYLDGAYPYFTSLIEGTDGNLYGTTSSEGAGGDSGTIFKLGVTLTSGCTYNTIVNIPCNQPIDLGITASVNPCLTNNGSISVLATGGYPTYTYTLTNGVTLFTLTGNTGSVKTFTNLTAGTWTATVTDISGNTDSVVVPLSFINLTTNVVGQDLCISVTGTNPTQHLVYVDNVLKYTSVSSPFSTCLSGLTGCGLTHVLKIVDSDSGCFVTTNFNIPCPPFGFLSATTINPFCFNGSAVINVVVTGGTAPYTYTLNQVSPSISSITQTTSTFLITPPYGTWFAQITDSNGTTSSSGNYTLSPRFYVADALFSTTGVTVTFSGASSAGSWTNVSVNGLAYNFLVDGTYTYSLPCGYNTVSVQCRSDIKPFPFCIYTFTANTPCDLGGYNTFIRPDCQGDQVSLLAVFITGGTPDFDVFVTNGSTTYSGTTSDNDIVFQNTGPNPINITGGTWTITTIDSNNDTFVQTINVTPSFNAAVPSISSTGATITISGGTPLYNVTIDSTNYGNLFTNSTYSFPLSPGSHTAVISQPFADYPCPITLTFTIPYENLDCSYIYSNPTCNNNTGSILVSVTGGTGLYTYTLTNGVDTYTSAPPLSAYDNYTFSNLGSDTWQVNVVDSNGASCDNTIILTSNFNVSVTGVSTNSYTTGNICLTIDGGTPPYLIYIDNILRLSANTSYVCLSATSNTTHTYRVEDSNPPCTIYTNVNVIDDTTFDVPTNWNSLVTGNCTNPSIPNFGITGGTIVSGGKITYTSTTQIAVPGTSGCFQNVVFTEKYINTNPFTAGKPITATYEFTIDFGEKYNMVYAAPFLVTPVSNIYYARYDLVTSSGGGPSAGITGIVTPPIPSNYANNTQYTGLVTIDTDNSLTYPPVVFSGYGIFFGASGSYNGSVGQIQLRGYDLKLVNYTIACPCIVSGTTFVPSVTSPTMSLVGFTYPNCEAASDGTITVSGVDGVPPYSFSATNGTTSYTSVNGIFNGLNSGTWYLSLVDSLGATTTLAQPITLYDTFYADVNSYSNGYCITITGGTQPYVVAIDSNPLSWDYNFDTNCYSANCNTVSVITVRDSS